MTDKKSGDEFLMFFFLTFFVIRHGGVVKKVRTCR